MSEQGSISRIGACVIRVLALALICAVCSGCISLLDQSRKKPERGSEGSEEKSEPKQPAKISVAKPSPTDTSSTQTGLRDKKKRGRSAPTLKIASREHLSKRDDKLVPNNDDLVKLAIAKAASMGSVKTMKICYRQEFDEWWISLYRDVGTLYDVKRFIWSLESQELRPFLAIKRVSKTRLKDDLGKTEPGRWCEIITLSTKEP